MGNRLQPLAPGTWYLDSPMPARVYFTVPDDYSAWGYGWGSPAVDIMSPGGASLQIMAVGRVFADPCDPAQGETDPPSGSTPDELLTALASVGELELTAPSDVMVDGYTARHVVLTVRETDNPCREVQLWSVGNRSVSMRPGEQSIVWAVDVDGTRIVLFGDLEHPALAEVIASIRINP